MFTSFLVLLELTKKVSLFGLYLRFDFDQIPHLVLECVALLFPSLLCFILQC